MQASKLQTALTKHTHYVLTCMCAHIVTPTHVHFTCIPYACTYRSPVLVTFVHIPAWYLFHSCRNHRGSGGSGGWCPLYFLKLTLCLHIRSLPTVLEPPPLIKPCSYVLLFYDLFAMFDAFTLRKNLRHLSWGQQLRQYVTKKSGLVCHHIILFIFGYLLVAVSYAL